MSSRRREAAELARALQLSTQQAQTISKTSPHSLSSSSTSGATQESKEMELRPVELTEASTVQQVFPVRPDMSGEIMPPPNTVPTTTETIEASTNSSAKQLTYLSEIGTFTPSNGNADTSILVPCTDSNNTPTTNTTSSSKVLPPSSLPPHVRPASDDLYSSPAPFVPPYVQGSSSNNGSHPSHMSSTEVSSNRPLFSPNQLQSSVPSESSAELPAKKVKTYGKSSQATPSSSSIKRFGDGLAAPIGVSSSSPRAAHPQDKGESTIFYPEGEDGVSLRSAGLRRSSQSPQKQANLASPDPLDSLAKKRKLLAASRAVVEVTLPGHLSPTKKAFEITAGDKDSAVRKRKRAGSAESEKPTSRGKEVEQPQVASDAELIQSSPANANLPVEASTLLLAPVNPQASQISSVSALSSAPANSISTSTSGPASKPKSKKRKSDPLEIPDIDDGVDDDFQPETRKAKLKPKTKAKSKETKEKTEKKTPAKKGKKALSSAEVAEEPEGVPATVTSASNDTEQSTMTSNMAEAVEPELALAPATEPTPEVQSVIEPQLPTAPKPAAEPILAAPGPKPTKTSKKKASSKKKATRQPIEVADKENSRSPSKSPAKSPTKPANPPEQPSSTNAVRSPTPPRQPLARASSNTGISTPQPSSSSSRTMSSGGREGTPVDVKFRNPRKDLPSVLAKFGGHKPTGMSKKLKIVPLHSKIGPPAKALPPVPKKPQKKVESEDEDDEVDGEKKIKPGSKEWLMMED
ncbi:hypothetical protein C345_00528 [Cryptococcus neoformans A2-102-5]|uniref:Uncharacterized protein n=1 Tax=Cryptococcus neoformans Tu259-1 TaxID=1230072 RepID=A0A854QM76_CRYNE|nr:hypothetical protein C353_00801 [Cryptococcus neoformans var. grubii AD1-83a]OWZ58134.1 hypothetical protein C368_01308 [Cryptococcus neoformans var. grubii 125.91]OXG29138.1 hypothetical protein C361_00794 [Cryptococcus neoformans var. grubii Tu259-1]OXG69032.1 hypothetical protein C354_00804 [Cryptococcus neoformans var. grubii MW-RSA1955]OXG72357.1 hypothetical protein C352_00799 [Cryptococcus neoformans var. grubii CHC193]OXG99672.1 hypothetical protein C345_00528 [Cryptococcus neoforma